MNGLSFFLELNTPVHSFGAGLELRQKLDMP